jgi:hypothetical protein
MLMLASAIGISDARMMQVPHLRLTVKRLMVLVAAVAVIVGAITLMQRRRERFKAIAAEQRAAFQIGYFNNDTETQDDAAEQYHLGMALKYETAAERPWLSLAPDLPEPKVVRAFRVANDAVKNAYPGFDIKEYSIQVVTVHDPTVEGADLAFPCVKFRRKDNRAGLNVLVRDPVEIHVHDDGPAPRLTP